MITLIILLIIVILYLFLYFYYQKEKEKKELFNDILINHNKNRLSLKGYNYNDFTNFASPNSHIRILSQNTKGLPPDQMIYRNIPVPSNYAFLNTSSLTK